MSKPARTLALLTRPILRVHSGARFRHSLLQERGQVNIQPVRFRRPPVRSSRILRLAVQVAVTSYLFYLVNEYLLGYEEEEDEPRAETAAPSIAVASKPIQQGVEGTKAPEAEQVEELLVQLPDKLPEGAVFIPLWWGTRRPTTYYKNTDPEWQGYLKFVHDENKPRELREALYMRIVGALGPERTKLLGAPVRIQRTWLEFDYPLGPPPEYDRPGIEIADDYIALTSRPQSEEHYQRVTSALWPEAITRAFYRSFGVLCRLQYIRIRDLLSFNTGTEEPDPSAHNPFNLHEMAQSPQKEGSQMDSELEKLSGPRSTNSKTSSAPPSDTGAAKPPINGISSDSAKILSYLPSPLKVPGDLRLAVAMFKVSLLNFWQPPVVIDNGDIWISGTVELDGSKAKAIVGVRATFQPENTHIKQLDIRLLRMRPKRLSPRG